MNTKRSPDYDFVAPFYRYLSRFIFGNRISEATSRFFDRIPPGSKILIIGGGDGDILMDLFKFEKDLKITYLDISSKMIQMAKKKDPFPSDAVLFYTKENEVVDEEYDVIITPFFLDQLDQGEIAARARDHLRISNENSMWMVADFYDTRKWYHRLLLRCMYIFFFLFAGLRQQQLHDMWSIIEGSGWERSEMWNTPNGLFRSAVYRHKNT